MLVAALKLGILSAPGSRDGELKDHLDQAWSAWLAYGYDDIPGMPKLLYTDPDEINV